MVTDCETSSMIVTLHEASLLDYDLNLIYDSLIGLT